MSKMVRYNGRYESYYPCTKPTLLQVGKVYEVVNEKVSDWHTEYTLRGISGEFNSVWFDEVDSNEQFYVAYAKETPVVGERARLLRLIKANGKFEVVSWATSTVKSVFRLGGNVYQVKTKNSTYIVQLMV